MKTIAAALLALLTPAALAGQARGAPRPEPKHGVRMEWSRFATMRDGVKLSSDWYFPEGVEGRLPAVLIRTPYNKKPYRDGGSVAHFWAGQGYAVVVQDVRGKYESDGVFTVSANDPADGYDTMSWVASLPWSSGRIGTYGCSYLGENQLQLAALRHPSHTAAIAQAAGGAMRYFGLWNGGAIELVSLVGWFRTAGVKRHPKLSPDLPREEFLAYAPVFDFGVTVPDYPARRLADLLPVSAIHEIAGSPPNDWRDFVTHEPADPWWERMGYVAPSDSFDVPTLHVNSWYDPAPAETIALFQQMKRQSASARARDHQFLLLSPVAHCASEAGAAERTVLGERNVGDTRFDWWGTYLRWFDHWLKGADNGVPREPRVRYFEMGSNQWRAADDLPLPQAVPTPYYLHSNGRANSRMGDGVLRPARPAAQPPDRFVYDPGHPVPSRAGPICCTGTPPEPAGAVDQRDVEMRQDVLVYTSPPLPQPLTVTGPIRAVLYVSSDAPDTDFTVKLLDVQPDGTAYNLQEGIQRARYREGYERTVWMTPGQIYRVEVDLSATSNRFAAGHRIRVEVSSSNFPRFDRNLNTGGDNVTERAWRTATNTIHHSAQHPSHVLLPVVP